MEIRTQESQRFVPSKRCAMSSQQRRGSRARLHAARGDRWILPRLERLGGTVLASPRSSRAC